VLGTATSRSTVAEPLSGEELERVRDGSAVAEPEPCEACGAVPERAPNGLLHCWHTEDCERGPEEPSFCSRVSHHTVGFGNIAASVASSAPGTDGAYTNHRVATYQCAPCTTSRPRG
jgi:hypothetical protein